VVDYINVLLKLETTSYHYLLEFYGVSAKDLDDIALIESRMIQAVKESGASYLNHYFHKFAPQGVSGVIVIAESHISIHTWPEVGYAALDVFTCGYKGLADGIVQHLVNSFNPTKLKKDYVQRGDLSSIPDRYL
jgi:S-adenosylmethionine decarboxylase